MGNMNSKQFENRNRLDYNIINTKIIKMVL